MMTCYIMRKEVERMRETKQISETEYQKIKKEMDEHEKLHHQKAEPEEAKPKLKIKVLA